MPGLLTVAEDSDLKAAEQRLVSELRSRAKRQIEGVNSDGDVHVRDILPDQDLQSGGGNGWNGSDRDWVQSSLSATTLNEAYTLDSTDRAENKVIGFFAISSIASDIITNEVELEDGTGSTFERLQFEEAQTFSNGEYALLRNPVIFNEGKDGKIYIYPESAGTEQLVLHGAVAEKAGTTLGIRSQQEGSPPGRGNPTGTARRPQQ